MTRWARILEKKGFSTPQDWPLRVRPEGGERGALVDKCKNRLSTINLSTKFHKGVYVESVKKRGDLQLHSDGVELKTKKTRIEVTNTGYNTETYEDT